eukprot:TRINITY_DN9361_c0_g1_i1.p1 TRINITY_DN9361_c0_g1~~TRINITY_DN9361_c0_g1_i1.p1  ORF type:complete len:133 (+),score=13.92 TRINITY_DN9361_c0_g1_i1:41-400(+)
MYVGGNPPDPFDDLILEEALADEFDDHDVSSNRFLIELLDEEVDYFSLKLQIFYDGSDNPDSAYLYESLKCHNFSSPMLNTTMYCVCYTGCGAIHAPITWLSLFSLILIRMIGMICNTS